MQFLPYFHAFHKISDYISSTQLVKGQVVFCDPPPKLDFPVDFEVCHQDMSSNFALKMHALLCRGYLKGRDWYDFNWYIAQKVTPNLLLLQNALIQYGPWKGQNLDINHEWVVEELSQKIASINWNKAAEDVEPFMKVLEQNSLKLWNERFFMNKLQKLYGE